MKKHKPIYQSFSYHNRSSKQVGFNLIEMLVVIIVISIIVTIATPYFQDYLHKSEAKSAHNQIHSAIRTAKVESFIRHQHVVMCLANIHNQCNRNAQNRLIVFSDLNDNHIYDAGRDSLFLIKKLNLNYGHVYLRAAANRHYAKFFADSGLPRGHFGHIKYCPNNASNTYKYIVSFNKLGGIKYKPNSIHPSDCPT
ncbi:Tfp pilus assembly protein FimT/FimU [Psychrobacter sp. I-STPA6b]|uniref:pilus assembly FimT family protein n=1 Tax=Psychrobacter sp. I-STPA6b TaxID=2585718 RepID=UPI001D0C0B2F|nr:GspH/FimT family pseudopilin [Psychrobacter sp. I-STPA6b]